MIYCLDPFALIRHRFRAWLNARQLSAGDISGTGISNSFRPLYLPGTLFVAVALLAGWLQRGTPASLADAPWSTLSPPPRLWDLRAKRGRSFA